MKGAVFAMLMAVAYGTNSSNSSSSALSSSSASAVASSSSSASSALSSSSATVVASSSSAGNSTTASSSTATTTAKSTVTQVYTFADLTTSTYIGDTKYNMECAYTNTVEGASPPSWCTTTTVSPYRTYKSGISITSSAARRSA